MKIILLFIIFSVSKLCAQPNSGARFAALADATAAMGDIWSLNANQAGLLDVKAPVLGINYFQPFRGQKINSQTAVLALPIKHHILGLGFYRYGFETYKEQELQLAYTRAFGPNFSAALALHWHQLNIEQYGHSGTYSIDVGMQYRLKPALRLGAHISNLSNNAFDRELSYAAIPLRMQLGAAYQPSDAVLLAAAFEQISGKQPAFKLGLEYQLIPSISLRGGCRMLPFSASAGIGLNWKSIQLDLAYQSQGVLGYATQFGLTYAF